jgi:sugar O-acyltransferase (sialic acid O-acetyltransferase NeuD family)
MSKSALVIGAGGHARVVGSILHAKGVSIHGYLDGNFVAGKQELIKYGPLLGSPEDIQAYAPELYEIYIAIGDNQRRREIFEQLAAGGYAMPALVHPSAIIETDCAIGKGAQICLGAILATEVTIAEGVIVNSGSSIDHEGKVGAFSHIAPGAILAGRVTVGCEVFVGMGARVAQGLHIGDGAIVGAGAIVLKDVPPGARVLGVHH